MEMEFQSTFPQGERPTILCIRREYSDFNPRSHKGNDLCGITAEITKMEFQSTFPQGERQHECIPLWRHQAISIHVPTRGTTKPAVFAVPSRHYFNPRSHKGNDLFQSPFSHTVLLISIHVPTRGTTLQKQPFSTY